MLRALHRTSAVAFYLLGSSFFLAALLLRNDAGGPWPAWWLQVGDLPLACSAAVYAGLSFHRSLRLRDGEARPIGIAIGVILTLCFLLLAVLNFWPG